MAPDSDYLKRMGLRAQAIRKGLTPKTTQADLAKEIGVSVNTIRRFEGGERIDDSTAQAIIARLGIGRQVDLLSSGEAALVSWVRGKEVDPIWIVDLLEVVLSARYLVQPAT